MSIYVMCACGQEFETSEANAGKSTLCPICGRVLTLPGAEPAPARGPVPGELLQIRDEPIPTVTSRAAMASLALGALFFFGCLSGLPAILVGRRALRGIRWSGGRIRGRGMAVAGIVLGVIGCLFTIALLMLPLTESREAARRAQCTNNLKQIGLAMHNYHSAYDCLPPAAITDKSGRPLLSWRVAILPFYESSSLYSEFHLDEPWDSPHNLSLLPRMPYCFGCPSDDTLKPGMTTYQAVIGVETAFMPDFKPVRFEDIADGLSGTILIGESRRAVPWTKPEDLHVDMTVPITGLGSHHDKGFNACFADGAVHFIKNNIDPNVLRANLTRSGYEVFSVAGF